MNRSTTAILVAAGTGSRMNTSIRKPFIELFQKPIFIYSLEVLCRSKYIENIIMVINPLDKELVESILEKYSFKDKVTLLNGGLTRQDSVYNGIIASPDSDLILIHDAARPFVDDDIIYRSIEDAYNFGASVVSIPVINTVKIADENGFVQSTLKRDRLWAAQTPQTFRAKLIKEASSYAKNNDIVCTDDACLLESFGLKVKITMGSDKNIKITTLKDIYIAEQIISEKK